MGRRFEALDGMRGLAAVAVLLLHLGRTHAPWLCPRGYLAVDFFFTLSGFVIAHAYEARLRGGWPARRFLAARLVRLYPMIALGALVGLVGYGGLYGPGALLLALVTGLLLLPTALAPASEGRVAVPINPPTWSLSFEVAVGAAFALAAPRLSDRALAGVLALSAPALLAAVVAFDGAKFGAAWPDFWAGAVRVCFPFFAGVAIHWLRRAGRLDRCRAPLPILLVGLAALFQIPERPGLDGPLDAAAVLVAFPLLVACGGNAGAAGARPLCVAAGALSYPLYALQGGVAPHLRDLPSRLGLDGAGALAVLLASAAAYAALCWLVLTACDRPLRRALAARWRLTDDAPTPGPPARGPGPRP